MNQSPPNSGKPPQHPDTARGPERAASPSSADADARALADGALASPDARSPDFSSSEFDLETRAVRAGFDRTNYGEHSEPMFLTSSFVHTSAANAAAKFS